MALDIEGSSKSFGGKMVHFRHQSPSVGTRMEAALFLPPQASSSSPVPVLIYLAGLTCNRDNGSTKALLHAYASRVGLAVLFPDTSPRSPRDKDGNIIKETIIPGAHVIDKKDKEYDIGEGAGFYIDAVKEPYSKHFHMETYISKELPELVFAHFKELDPSRVSISGHSMGGHGALTLFLKNPGKYKSVSAFAPICNPTQAPWGEKAFTKYLGEDREEWKKHDATELVKKWNGGSLNCLIDVGLADSNLENQLLLENFNTALKEASVEGVKIRYQDGYDHSYWFISTFAEDHINHAAKALGLA